MTTEQLQKNPQRQTELSQEIAALESKINSLQSHLDSLQNKPLTPEASIQGATSEEIIKQAQEAVKQQQEALARQTEAEAIERSLKVFRSQLAEKQESLQILRRSSEFERMQALAYEFNDYIDKAFFTLEKMKKIHEEIRTKAYSPLGISADLNEAPYCSIHETIVRVRRRLDAKRDS